MRGLVQASVPFAEYIRFWQVIKHLWLLREIFGGCGPIKILYPLVSWDCREVKVEPRVKFVSQPLWLLLPPDVRAWSDIGLRWELHLSTSNYFVHEIHCINGTLRFQSNITRAHSIKLLKILVSLANRLFIINRIEARFFLLER